MENLQETLSLDVEKQKIFEEKIQAYKKERSSKDGFVPGVIYVGHIPEGFFEKEMMRYFSQFGKVTRLRLVRSKKTGGSRGFAFVEFECDEVAKIVADTMNNYLMFGKLLKCEFIPAEKIKHDLFVGWKKTHQVAYVQNRKKHNKQKTERREKMNWFKRLEKLELAKKRLAQIGINFNLDIKLPKLESAKRYLTAKTEQLNVKSSGKSIPSKTDVNDTTVSLFNETTNSRKALRNALKGKTSTPIYGRCKVADDTSKYVLEIDPSEEEITFKTPPNVVKVVKKKQTTGWKETEITKGAVPVAKRSKKERARSLSSGWKVSSR